MLSGQCSEINIEEFYLRYGTIVLRRCRQLLKNEERARDAAQEEPLDFTFAYVFNPEKKLHWRITSLVGSGFASGAGVFYIFEPGAEIILNISGIVRIQAGISIPITDRENNSGFNSPILNVGFQFGQ